MTDERPASGYTHGYAETVVRVMRGRTAEHEGAFFLRHLRAGMRLIDVGCGPGTITVGLAAAVAPGDVLGIDLEPEMIERARALANEQGITNVRFEVGRAEALPAPDESFDAAFEHTLLEHVSDPLRVLQEMRRLLRPGGVIGLADGDWGTMLIEPPIPAVADALALYERVWRHNGGDARFGRRQRPLMRQAGLRAGETTLYGSPFLADAADALVGVILAPRVAERAIELGWTDRPTLERYAEGIRDWGTHPDALLITARLQSVGWRPEA